MAHSYVALRGAARAMRTGLRRPRDFRAGVGHETWSLLKGFGSARIATVEADRLACTRDAVISSYVDQRHRAVVAALCLGLEARTFFEIGTNRGRTVLGVARSSPQLQAYTLDLPDRAASDAVALDVRDEDRGFFVGPWTRGEAFAGAPESARIIQLWGDSATFDFSPYHRRMDVVFVDGAHSLAYVRHDTEAAFAMMSEEGAIVWDDYPGIPDVYRHLTELAAGLRPAPFHIAGTRLVVFSRRPLLEG